MFKRIKNLLTAFAVAGLLAAPVLAPATVLAADDISGGLACGSQLDVSSVDNPNCSIDEGVQSEKLNDIIKLVINIFSLVVGLAAVIMIIIGGLKYITSGGDSGNIQSAKNTILYAIIGLVVVALAQFIVRFVLSRVSSV